MSSINAFQTGDDFISFNTSPSPPPEVSQAGPSKLPLSSSNGANRAGGKGKGKAKEELDSEDEDLLARKAGKRKDNENAEDVRGKGKKGEKEKSGKKEKSRGKRGRDGDGDDDDGGPPTGPRNLKEERRAAERGAPWVSLLDWGACRDPAEMLNAEITAFYRFMSPSKAEFEVRLYVIELITRAIHAIWPDAEVSPFGSWQTQLYLPQGDIDLVVANKRFSEANKARLLAELARAMRQAYITDVVAIISKARVPIIKFVTTEGKLNVDISLNQTNGISAGRIVNQYLDVLPGARQLILVVKAFLSQRSMNEVYTGGLGSYAVICLVISFLQVHPKLRRSEIDPEQNLGTLLVEFFELYGRNFNFDEVGISIRRGGFYYSKRSRGWQRPNQAYLLSVEDPQDPDNDISGGSFGIRQVKSTLSGAYQILQAKLFERAAQMSRKGWKARDEDPVELSLLTAVMGVTKETLKHRAGLQKLHDEGRLQRMLDIPLDANPADYVVNYRSPPRIGEKRAAGDASNNNGNRDAEVGPSPSKRTRRGSPMIQAIVVDDDEVDEADMADSSDEYDVDEEDLVNGDDQNYDDDGDDDENDSGIVEIFPNGVGGVGRSANESVSPISANGHQSHQKEAEVEEEDSRYALGTPRKVANGKKGNGKPAKTSESDADESEDSIVALDELPASQQSGRSTGSRMGSAARRAFWAAKGAKDDEDAEDGEISS